MQLSVAAVRQCICISHVYLYAYLYLSSSSGSSLRCQPNNMRTEAEARRPNNVFRVRLTFCVFNRFFCASGKLYLPDTLAPTGIDCVACAVFNYSTPCAFELVLNATKALQVFEAEAETETQTKPKPKPTRCKLVLVINYIET